MADGSFEEFYDATYHRLLRQLVLMTGDRGDAEDLLQDAYGRAAVRWTRLRDYQAPEAWVRRVALRLATDRARRTRRRAAALLRLRPLLPGPRSPRWTRRLTRPTRWTPTITRGLIQPPLRPLKFYRSMDRLESNRHSG
jgi:DNA-directed RNA polymerase specialized sigma24 family protein